MNDKTLNVQTSGTHEWSVTDPMYIHYERTEATGYREIDALFDEYQLPKKAHFVDVGAGKGRMIFYVNQRFNVPTTAIELNEEVFQLLKENKQTYQKSFPNRASITLENVPAQDFTVLPEHNVFYFFNPFSLMIFDQVMQQIEYSLRRDPRPVDLILYYPMWDFKGYMKDQKNFDLIHYIGLPWFDECVDHFVVYRYTPSKA